MPASKAISSLPGPHIILTVLAVVLGMLIPSGRSPLLTDAAPATTQPRVFFGVSVNAWPDHAAALDEFELAVRKKPSLIMDYRDWAHFPRFDIELAKRVRARGAALMLTWEPWDYTRGPNQPSYRLSRIIAGAYNAHIRRWARGIKSWGHRVILRFAHEMNGNWNSWSEGINGNRPGEYARAWRHVYRLFRRVGARNVTWVWSPNVISSSSPPLRRLYPGDEYVDWVGVDGYNWGNRQPQWGSRWQSFDEVFKPTLSRLRYLTNKPLVIAETASTEHGGDKAAWISGLFASLKRQPDIVAFVWFNHNKETDWRVTSSPSAQEAFATGVADSRYAGGH